MPTNLSPEEREARITALLLGELLPAEETQVRAALAADPELARVHDGLKRTVELLRATAVVDESALAGGAPTRLPDARRGKLLETFKKPALPQPVEKRSRLSRLAPWFVPMSIAAALAGLLAVSLPRSAMSRSKARAERVTKLSAFDVDLIRDEPGQKAERKSGETDLRRFSLPSGGAKTDSRVQVSGQASAEDFAIMAGESRVRGLEERGGSDLLSRPQVTTMSGRESQIAFSDSRYVVSDLESRVPTINSSAPVAAQPEGKASREDYVARKLNLGIAVTTDGGDFLGAGQMVPGKHFVVNGFAANLRPTPAPATPPPPSESQPARGVNSVNVAGYANKEMDAGRPLALSRLSAGDRPASVDAAGLPVAPPSEAPAMPALKPTSEDLFARVENEWADSSGRRDPAGNKAGAAPARKSVTEFGFEAAPSLQEESKRSGSRSDLASSARANAPRNVVVGSLGELQQERDFDAYFAKPQSGGGFGGAAAPSSGPSAESGPSRWRGTVAVGGAVGGGADYDGVSIAGGAGAPARKQSVTEVSKYLGAQAGSAPTFTPPAASAPVRVVVDNSTWDVAARIDGRISGATEAQLAQSLALGDMDGDALKRKSEGWFGVNGGQLGVDGRNTAGGGGGGGAVGSARTKAQAQTRRPSLEALVADAQSDFLATPQPDMSIRARFMNVEQDASVSTTDGTTTKSKKADAKSAGAQWGSVADTMKGTAAGRFFYEQNRSGQLAEFGGEAAMDGGVALFINGAETLGRQQQPSDPSGTITVTGTAAAGPTLNYSFSSGGTHAYAVDGLAQAQKDATATFTDLAKDGRATGTSGKGFGVGGAGALGVALDDFNERLVDRDVRLAGVAVLSDEHKTPVTKAGKEMQKLAELEVREKAVAPVELEKLDRLSVRRSGVEQVKQLAELSKEQAEASIEAKRKTPSAGAMFTNSISSRSLIVAATNLTAPRSEPATSPPTPQPEVLTRDNAFSTFSLNVADVSFKLAAATLERSAMPDAGGIRSEEFLNAFDYRDPQPAPGLPIAFAWERAQYPFAQNRDVLRFSVKTAAAGRDGGRPLNIVLLLDNSGSMERADRVAIIRQALLSLAGQMQAQDKLSVVTFARTARLWVDGVSGAQAAEVAKKIGDLTPEGGTNLEDALDLAYRTALRHYAPTAINRVVVLTDGAANLGNVQPEQLKAKVESFRKQGVALDCFGIGWDGYNDDLLEQLSRNGDGRYGFVNTPEEATTEFVGQLAGALHVAASDVKVQVEFNPKRVTAYRQIGYAKHQLTKQQFRDNTVDAAEIGASEAGNGLYIIETNPRGSGPIATVRVRFKVPGTSDYREQEWEVPFGSAPALEHSTAAMRLAAGSAAFAEWLAGSPFAGEVTPDRLLGILSGVPQTFGADPRPKKLEWMVRQAKSISGR